MLPDATVVPPLSSNAIPHKYFLIIIIIVIVFSLSSAAAYVNFIAVIAATVVELFSTPRINDNLLIPMVLALILTIGGIG